MLFTKLFGFSGLLKTKAMLDFSTKNYYELTAEATDGLYVSLLIHNLKSKYFKSDCDFNTNVVVLIINDY